MRRASIPLSTVDMLSVRPQRWSWGRNLDVRNGRDIQLLNSSSLRCVAGRSPEIRELVDFSVCKIGSGQPVPGLNEVDRDDRRRKIWAL